MRLVATWKKPGFRLSLDWSPDGERGVARDRELRLQAFTRSGELLWRSRDVPGYPVRWSAGGRFVVGGGGHDNSRSLTVLDAETGQVLRKLASRARTFAVIGGTETLVAAGHGVVRWNLEDGTSDVLDVRAESESPADPAALTLVASSSNGERLAVAHHLGQSMLLERTPVWILPASGGPAMVVHAITGLERIALSPDGSRLAAVSNGGEVEVFHLGRERRIAARLPGAGWYGADLSWSKSGALLAVGGRGAFDEGGASTGGAYVYAVEEERLSRVARYGGEVRRVAFSPVDEDLVLAVRDDESRVFELLMLELR